MGHESQYQTTMSEIKLYFAGGLSTNPFDIAEILRPLFQSLIHEIELKHEQFGEDLHEFAEALFFEICIRLLDDLELYQYSLDLPLVSRYIACEAAVSYSMSGVVDALDEEFRTSRIGAAYLGAMLYLITFELKQKQSGISNQ